MGTDTTLTYILVDFENVQPTDMGLLNGERYQLMIFRGPHQNKLDFDIAEAIQPLGERVTYIQSHKQGKNALDFHIAFHIGRLIEENESKGMGERRDSRFVVISKDAGFDALLSHIRTLGYSATKAANIGQALKSSIQAAPAKKPSTPQSTTPSQSQNHAAKKAQAAKSEVGKAGDKHKATAHKILGKEDKMKVIANLRKHPSIRPAKRKTLENHIHSLLGKKFTAKAVNALVAMLENEGVIKFDGLKIIEYKLPKIKQVKASSA